MNAPVTMKWNVRFTTQTKGRRVLRHEPSSNATRSPLGRVPRISRLMALAIKMDGLVRSGAVKDYAELARLGNVSRARITQIMNLLNLAPEIQEELLHLPLTTQGRDDLTLRNLQPVALQIDWQRQRAIWMNLRTSH